MGATITAHVQHSKMHMCAVRPAPYSAYAVEVENEKVSAAKQAVIAAVGRWRDRVMADTGLNAAQWAERASINPTTITRGMKADAASTVKLENLHLLAEAAKVPSIIEYLDGPAAAKIGPPIAPPAETLAVIFDELAAELVGVHVPESVLRPAGRILELSLRLVAGNPAIHANLDAVRAVVRTAAARLPQTTPEG